MKFRYTKLPDLLLPGNYNWYPLVQICLRYYNKGRHMHALIDSGAIDCIFPASVGEVPGIDVTSGRQKTYFGLAEQATVGFQHTVRLQVTGFDHWITLDVGFIQSEHVLPLLGQSGFFSHYQIIFERFRYQVKIKSREQALVRGKRGH